MNDRALLQRRALHLEYTTIAWNLSESAITIGLGVVAGSLALVGFGVDSLIEVFASIVVVWHLAPGHASDHPDRTVRALQLVAGALLLKAETLVAATARDLSTGRESGESPWGIAYLAVTVVVMFTLAALKRRIAARLDSAPLRSEAAMSFLDAILAAATLAGLALNAALGWWWADPAAALLVALAAVGEAYENWEEAAEIAGDRAEGIP